MKRMLVLAMIAMLSVSTVSAALTEADLTPAAINRAMVATAPENRQAFAREVINAVASLPIDDATKTERLVSVARALIAGAGPQAVNVIAEIYNSLPVQHLQAVSELLAKNNFNQKTNGLKDEAFDKLVASIVKSASEYIEASGTDSPAVRIGILAAGFTQASSDPERTQGAVLNNVPVAVKGAVTTYLAASAKGERDIIAAAAGVDNVEETPADPDADSVVPGKNDADTATSDSAPPPPPADDPDYLDSEPPSQAEADRGDSGDDADVASVPLLSRWATDGLGMVLDNITMATYDWETADPRQVQRSKPVPTLPGQELDEDTPGLPAPGMPDVETSQPEEEPEILPAPSPGYPNQRI